MRLLIDTNVFPEIVLEREGAAEARALLSGTEQHDFFISAFSLHSIGVILFRRKRHTAFRQFLQDMLVGTGARVVSLLLEEMDSVVSAARDFELDFDDAYQYAVATKLDLPIVSFDSDFDRTERGRKTPADLLPT